MGMDVTVTYWEKHNWLLHMTFRWLFPGEENHFKRCVQETLELTEVIEISRKKGSVLNKFIENKLNAN